MVRAKNVELAYIKEQSGDIVIGQSADYFGSSTDTKPTDKVVGGSTFIETDTGNFYYFDENSSTWVKKNESGGGGGGDFTFAKITTDGPPIRMYGAFYGTVQMPGEPAMGMTIPGNSAGFDTIILYQGKAILTTDDDYENISGNITRTGDAEYLVTGDCTITTDDK